MSSNAGGGDRGDTTTVLPSSFSDSPPASAPLVDGAKRSRSDPLERAEVTVCADGGPSIPSLVNMFLGSPLGSTSAAALPAILSMSDAVPPVPVPVPQEEG